MSLICRKLTFVFLANNGDVLYVVVKCTVSTIVVYIVIVFAWFSN